MSWSFSAIGRAKAVAALARKEAHNNGVPYCAEPEETYRKDCLENIAKMSETLVAQGGEPVVHVNASGSMWKDGDTVKSHTLSLDFNPLQGGFCE